MGAAAQATRTEMGDNECRTGRGAAKEDAQMESVIGQDPYVGAMVMGVVYFAAVAALGTLACWIVGLVRPQGGEL